MICHSCSLRPLGMKTVEVLELLKSATPTQDNIETHLNRLAKEPDSLPVDFQFNSDLEESF